jgi:hypothetical protein
MRLLVLDYVVFCYLYDNLYISSLCVYDAFTIMAIMFGTSYVVSDDRKVCYFFGNPSHHFTA